MRVSIVFSVVIVFTLIAGTHQRHGGHRRRRLGKDSGVEQNEDGWRPMGDRGHRRHGLFKTDIRTGRFFPGNGLHHKIFDMFGSRSNEDRSSRTGPAQPGIRQCRPGAFCFRQWLDDLGLKVGLGIDFSGIFGQEKKWWKGPNVCVNRDEKEEDIKNGPNVANHHFVSTSSCDETETVYKCSSSMQMLGKKKTYTVTYECCHGYQRKPPYDTPGCTEVPELGDIIETVRKLGLVELGKAIDSVELNALLQEGNYTLFAPTNEALKKFEPTKKSKDVVIVNNQILKMVHDVKSMMSAHLLPGFVRSSSFSDELLLQPVNPHSSIRINFYDQPKKLTTANCAPILSMDNMATNGVVHVVEKVLTPVRDSVLHLIAKRPELSIFKTVLSQTGLSKMLKEDGQYTVLAPTNAAFKKLGSVAFENLSNGDSCLTNILKSHIFPNVICTSVIEGHVQTVNLLDHSLHLNRDKDGKMFVEASQIVSADIMGTNGVMHVVDQLIIPNEALDVIDVSKKVEANEFLRLVEKAGMTDEMKMLENATVFIPTDSAFKELPVEVAETLYSDPEALRSIVHYHIADSAMRADELLDGDTVPSHKSKKSLSIREFTSFPFGLGWIQTIGCAPIVQKDIKSCTGVTHVIDKVMFPPSGNVLDTLTQLPQFSKLVHLLKKAEMADDLQKDGAITFFAPTNKALEDMGKESYNKLIEHPENLKSFLQHHIINEARCCAGIFDTKWLVQPTYETLSKDRITLARQHNKPYVNRTPIKICDLVATNGIVHAIDEVLDKAYDKYVDQKSTMFGNTDWDSMFDRITDIEDWKWDMNDDEK